MDKVIMAVDLDTIIFTGFLFINLAVGLFYSKGIKSTAEYAIGNRSFPTNSLIATIIASYIGGGVFISTLSEVYKHGLYYIIPVLGEPVAFIIMGLFFVPRMTEFFGEVSVAEVMGKFYGKSARIITAITGILCASGVVALQFIVATSIMKIFFDINSFAALALSTTVIIMYSSFGGIKAVTITDILQFFTFTAIIPIISLIIWRETDFTTVLNTLSNNPNFDYKEVLNISHPRFLPMVMLFIFFICPTLVPTFVQRVSMAKGVAQAQKSFIIAGIISLLVLIIMCSTSVLLLSSKPNLNPNELLPYIITHYTFTGFKGLTAICITAVLMSTADSYINSAAVLLMQDIIKPYFKFKNELTWCRFTSFVVGITAFAISYRSKTLLDALIMTMAFYMPVVVVPLTLAIFGFRSSGKVALTGMAAGALTVVAWLLWTNFSSSANIVGLNQEGFEGFNETVPGMVMNLVAFIIAHLIYGKEKHYISLEHQAVLAQLKDKRRKVMGSFLADAKDFNPMLFCTKNLPKSESVFLFTGMFAILAVFASTYSLSNDIQLKYSSLLNILYCTIILISSILCVYPIMPLHKSKNKNPVAIFWIVALLMLLVVSPSLVVLISHFELFSVITLLISSYILASLIGWQIALTMLASGMIISAVLYKAAFFHPITPDISEIGLQFKMVYGLFILGCCFIVFLRPKQEAHDLSEEMVDHLSHQVKDQNKQITNLSTLKQTFLRNLQHETNTPLTGVFSMSQALADCYSKLSDEQRQNAIESIKSSAERLISYVHNLVDISKLSGQNFKADIRKINLGRLLEESLLKCKRLYIPKEAEEDREIIVSIEPNIKAKCDEYLMKRSFENIIINAIQYCKKGVISVTLSQNDGKVIFIVKDEGIGIPQEELGSIFEPFATSSKTTTPAGGRGLGLAFVKEAIEIHGGLVTAASNSNGGSCFTISIPQS